MVKVEDGYDRRVDLRVEVAMDLIGLRVIFRGWLEDQRLHGVLVRCWHFRWFEGFLGVLNQKGSYVSAIGEEGCVASLTSPLE